MVNGCFIGQKNDVKKGHEKDRSDRHFDHRVTFEMLIVLKGMRDKDGGLWCELL